MGLRLHHNGIIFSDYRWQILVGVILELFAFSWLLGFTGKATSGIILLFMYYTVKWNCILLVYIDSSPVHLGIKCVWGSRSESLR